MNTLKATTVALTLAFGMAATAAHAFETDKIAEGQKVLGAEFAKLDTDANGELTGVEASYDKLFTAKHFTAADTNKNATLNQDEYAAYKSADQKQKMAVVIDDTVITTKAKADLLAEKDLKSLQISVETQKGQVILSGFVDSQLMKEKAELIVAKIEGVKSVKNSLVVKS